MDYFRTIFIILFVFFFVLPFFRKNKNKNKNKNLEDPFKKDEPKPKPKPNMPAATLNHGKSAREKHAEWDEAAWGKASKKLGKTIKNSGHNIPSWEKPKAGEPTRAEPKFGAPKEPEELPTTEKITIGFLTVIIVVILNIWSLVYFAIQEYEAADIIGGVRGAINTRNITFDGLYFYYININMAMVILFTIGSAYFLYQWLERNSTAPSLFVRLHSFMFLYIIADALSYNYFFPNIGFIGSFVDYRDLAVIFIFVFFVPYVLVSKRVENTFKNM